MTNKFEKYSGEFKIDVAGEELNLDVRLQDIKSLMVNQKDEMDEESMERLLDTFKEIITRSYPEDSEEDVEAFLTRNFTDFLMEFSDEMGWADKAELKDTRRGLKKKGFQQNQ